MQRYSIFILTLIFSGAVSFPVAQQSRIYTSPQTRFNEAKEFFQKEQYSLAYPLFKDLRNELRTTDRSNNSITYDEVKFYHIACGLQQNEIFAAEEGKNFVLLNYNPALTQKLSFHLAEYYFRKNDMREALNYYEQTGTENLSNKQIAEMKFHQGYAYFTLENFGKAAPLLESISKNSSDPNYKAANYYYGLIAYSNANYGSGLEAFRKIEKEAPYQKIVPFYVANIYYAQGRSDEALAYGESALKGADGYYDVPMKELIGHAWFEKGNYAKALPYLEDYVNKTKKVSRETLYQLSYCYYQANQLNKAVEGLKQLSGGEDSLSQNAMYILGDAYLRLGDKPNARNAFSFCAANSTNAAQQEVSKFNYAKLSYELGFQDVALNDFRKFLDEYPRSTYQKEAAEITASLLANTNNYREALNILDKLPTQSESVKRMYPKILYGRAMELINDQDFPAAKALLDKALNTPFNMQILPFVNFWEGELAYRQNQLDEAILFYNEYLRNPSYSSGEVSSIHARYNLGYCYYRRENYQQAASYFGEVAKNPSINARPVEQDAYIRLADCHYMLKNFSRAKTIYHTIINYSWASGDYATYQSAMIAGINSSNEKINLMKTIERKYPASLLVPDVNLEIAKTYLADEKYRDAIPYLNNVINSKVAANLKPGAQLKLGLANLNLNNKTEALNQFKKVVADYPNTIEANEALENIKAIYTAGGQTTEYIAYMNQIGKPIAVNEEDNLTYRGAENKYINRDFPGALIAFNQYLSKFPEGQNALDARFLRSEIYSQQKDWNNAVSGYAEVSDQGPSKYAERATLQAGRIYFFELQDYPKAEQYFLSLKSLAATAENRLEAMRGLLRSQYQQKKWDQAEDNAQDLLKEKNISVDDKVLALMVTARSEQDRGAYTEAIKNFRNVISNNKASFAAESRYEVASCYFSMNDLKNAEKSAFETIDKSGSYDYWITKAYILLGDIYFKQKDYFNAKATLQSVVDNSKITELRTEAEQKLETVKKAEKENSQIAG